MSEVEIYSASGEVALKKNNLTTVVSEFLANFLSDNTRAAYTTDFFDFAAFLNENFPPVNGPKEITRNHVLKYRDFLRKHYAPNSIHRKLSSLASLFSELQDAQIIELNPLAGVKRPKAVNVNQATGFSDEEVNRICSFYGDDTIQNLQKKTILTFLCYTGCRISEAVNIKVSDIRFEKEIPIVLINGKGSKLRKIPLHPKLWATLSELIRRREKKHDDYIFTSVKRPLTSPLTRDAAHKLLKKTLLSLGMDVSRSLHSFRRSVISNLLENGHRIESVAKVSGHSNINTTKGYIVREEKIEDNPLLGLNFKD